MEHWFDDLTRRIGKQPMSRRGMVSLTARLGAVVAGTSLFGREATAISAAEVTAAPSAVGVLQAGASTCKVDDSYGLLKTEFSVSSAGGRAPLTLSHSFSAEVATGNTFSTLTVRSGNEVIRKLSTMAVAGGVGAATTSQGARYTGSKSSFFRTDGATVQGIVDDRLTEPAQLAADVSTLRFKDGKPDRPALQAAPDLDQQVTELLRQSQARLVRCQPDSKAPKRISACTQRQLDCREAWVRCSLAAAHSSLACGPLASVCYLKTVNATCDRAIQQCFTTAKSSGACCPEYCKGDSTCCQTSWGCCPSSSQTKIDGKAVSKAWPTCPRCGPLTAPVTPYPSPKPPRKPGPDAAPKPRP
jgi:hypothetical protein